MKIKKSDALAKLIIAFEEYEAQMGVESMAETLAMSLLACTCRYQDSAVVEYPVETHFVTGTVVVNILPKSPANDAV